MSSVSVDEEPSRALALAPQWYDDPCVKCRKIAIILAGRSRWGSFGRNLKVQSHPPGLILAKFHLR